jgi:uncharacterized protein
VGLLGWLLLGIFTGGIGTLIGAGGGFLLMPILLLVYPKEAPDRLAALSLAVILANALSGTIAYARMGRIPYRPALIFAAAALPGAALGAVATAHLSLRRFDEAFGVLLLGVAIYLLARAGRSSDDSQATEPPPHSTTLGVSLSAGVGLVSNLFGIGGGILHVPLLAYVLRFPVHLATATSHFVLAVSALAGVVVHLEHGSYGSGAAPLLPLALGVAAGAQVGARLSPRVSPAWILRLLGLGLAVMGARIFLGGLAR